MMDQKRMDAVVELARALIAQSSESGQEAGAAAVLRQYMEQAGFDRIISDEYGNLLGRLAGSRPGKRVLLDGHIDTVPVGDRSAWSHDPFAGEIENGPALRPGRLRHEGGRGGLHRRCGLFRPGPGQGFPR